MAERTILNLVVQIKTANDSEPWFASLEPPEGGDKLIFFSPLELVRHLVLISGKTVLEE